MNMTYAGRLYCFNSDCEYHKGTFICPLHIIAYMDCLNKIGIEYEFLGET